MNKTKDAKLRYKSAILEMKRNHPNGILGFEAKEICRKHGTNNSILTLLKGTGHAVKKDKFMVIGGGGRYRSDGQ